MTMSDPAATTKETQGQLSTKRKTIDSGSSQGLQIIQTGIEFDPSGLDSYEGLFRKLEEIFGIEICGPEKKWEVLYIDDENDLLLVEESLWPWHEFCSAVKGIYLCECEELKRNMKSAIPMADQKMGIPSNK